MFRDWIGYCFKYVNTNNTNPYLSWLLQRYCVVIQ